VVKDGRITEGSSAYNEEKIMEIKIEESYDESKPGTIKLDGRVDLGDVSSVVKEFDGDPEDEDALSDFLDDKFTGPDWNKKLAREIDEITEEEFPGVEAISEVTILEWPTKIEDLKSGEIYFEADIQIELDNFYTAVIKMQDSFKDFFEREIS